MRGLDRTKLSSEWLKLLLIAGGFLILQDQILGVRYDLYGHRERIASAETRKEAQQGLAQERVEGVVEACAHEVARARGELEEAILRLDGRRDELLDLIDLRNRELEGALVDRLASERDEISTTRFALEAGTARLERLFQGSAKDPREMKRKMILPTVQLKGNGTVGSGVLIYSEPQGATVNGEAPEYATFVLTAYHVVLEVLGDTVDDGILHEIHVLPEADATATEVLPARLILFDRGRDVALLRLGSTRRFAEVAELLPRGELDRVDIFTRAYAVGCPLGNRPLPTVGEISSKSKVVSDQVFWMLSAPTFFGNSGGGVYLADSCRLIGVSSMIYTYGKTHPAVVPHMGLFVPLDSIYKWLDAEGYSFVAERRAIPADRRRLSAFESPAASVQPASSPAGPDPF